MTSTFDLLTMGRSSIDLYANDVGAVFMDSKSFAGYELLKTNKPVEIVYWQPE
jgi:hypothetical protein